MWKAGLTYTDSNSLEWIQPKYFYLFCPEDGNKLFVRNVGIYLVHVQDVDSHLKENRLRNAIFFALALKYRIFCVVLGFSHFCRVDMFPYISLHARRRSILTSRSDAHKSNSLWNYCKHFGYSVLFYNIEDVQNIARKTNCIAVLY